MSGVLDRMVKQARGVLPTIQPLIAPRLAPVASGIQESLAEVEVPSQAPEDSWRKSPMIAPRFAPVASGIQESLAEVDMPSQADEDSRRKTTLPHESSEKVVERVPHMIDSALPTSESSKPPMRSQMESKHYRTRMQELDTPPEPDKTPNRTAKNARPSEEVALQETQKFAVRAVMVESPKDEAVEAATVKRTPPMSDGDDLEVAVRANRAILTMSERTEMAMEVKHAAHGNEAAQTATLDSSAEQRTEIHISIGSIELRAPRVESNPPAPPFRPRVTLDDFLHRKPGSAA